MVSLSASVSEAPSEACLNHEGKMSSRNEQSASSDITSEKKSGEALMMEGGMQLVDEPQQHWQEGYQQAKDESGVD